MKYLGHWMCRVHTPLGIQEVEFVIANRAGVLQGEARNNEEVVDLQDLRVEEGRLRWSQRVTKPMRLTIRFDVVSDGDGLTGTAKAGVFPRSRVEGRRRDGEGPVSQAGRTAPHSSTPIVSERDETGRRLRWPALSVDTTPFGGRRVEVGMLAFPGMTALDLIGPHAVLSGPTSVRLIAKTSQPLVSDTGITITPDLSFADAPVDLDILFVPGGPGQVDVMRDEATLAFLADRGSRARFVTSACTGSLILGAAGLLRGYKATTHWAALDLLSSFGAEPVADRVVIDRNRITGGGVTAGIDFGLTLLDVLFGERVAKTTQLMMEYAPAPPFRAGRPEDAGEIITADAMRIMAPVAAETLAAVAAIPSRRQTVT